MLKRHVVREKLLLFFNIGCDYMTSLREAYGEAFGEDATTADYADAYSSGSLACCDNYGSLLAVGKSSHSGSCASDKTIVDDPTGCDGQIHCIPVSNVNTGLKVTDGGGECADLPEDVYNNNLCYLYYQKDAVNSRGTGVDDGWCKQGADQMCAADYDNTTPIDPAEGWVPCDSDECLACSDRPRDDPCTIDGVNICFDNCDNNEDCTDPLVCMDVGHLDADGNAAPHCMSDVYNPDEGGDGGTNCTFETGNNNKNQYCVSPSMCGCSSYTDKSACEASETEVGAKEECTWDTATSTCSITHDSECAYDPGSVDNVVQSCIDVAQISETCEEHGTKQSSCEDHYMCDTDEICMWELNEATEEGACITNGRTCTRSFDLLHEGSHRDGDPHTIRDTSSSMLGSSCSRWHRPAWRVP